MPKYKNIRIPKRGGGTRLQRVQVLKSGKYRFVKNTSRSRSRKATSKTKLRKRRRYMARRKKRSKKRNFKVPMATVLGLAAGFVGPMGDSPIEWAQKGDFRSAIVRLAKSYTGYDANDGKWKPGLMAAGVAPLVIGGLVSKFVGGAPLNVNKKINIPFIKI